MKKYNYKIDRKKEKAKGITLVALVITVVIMLILAGVAIAAVVDADGLFSKTRDATEVYQNASRDENDIVQDMINQIDEYLGEVNIGESGDDDNPPVGNGPIGVIVSQNQTFSGGTKGTYNDPIIPKGFAPINENGAEWGTAEGYKKGLVITDAVDGNRKSTGNEFVWVPVDGTTITFERYNWGKNSGTYSNYIETVPTAITTSVNNNGGFYIGRYEAGKPKGVTLATDGTVKPVSKQGAPVWNSIAWSEDGNNDETTPGNGAVTVARSMYTESDTNYGVVSTLIYGTQWDTALRFIGAFDTGEARYDTYATNSTGMGNYAGTEGGDPSLEIPDICGAYDVYRQKNIYDMAGNVWEWTVEQYSTNRVSRGGNFKRSGLDNPASCRGSNTSTTSEVTVGFRVALYIK